MYKFFVNDEQVQADTITIKNDDVNHIKNVLRIGINERIQICNKNTSQNYSCEIVEENLNSIKCKIIEPIHETTEANTYIHVFQGLPKSDKMENIIQKLTEIGVCEITPLVMERCVVKLDKASQEKKIPRWRKIAEVAAKQSKRDIIPLINYCTDIKNIYNQIKDYDIIITAYEEEKVQRVKEVLNNYKNVQNLKIALIIGPEGGISEEEIEELKKNNSKVVTLGKRILRTETAPVVLASIILYELNDI